MATELSLDELSARAERAGLKLPADELQKILPGVRRAHQQVRDLRELIDDGEEPAAIFRARRGRKD